MEVESAQKRRLNFFSVVNTKGAKVIPLVRKLLGNVQIEGEVIIEICSKKNKQLRPGTSF
jgi:hypothetical protein